MTDAGEEFIFGFVGAFYFLNALLVGYVFDCPLIIDDRSGGIPNRPRIFTNPQRQPKELLALAPEPLSDDFTEDYFRTILSRSRRSLKQLLLDQTKVLGLGNIYAVEALFLAGVNPLKEANSLSTRRANSLYQSIRGVLQEAIDAGSTLRIDMGDGIRLLTDKIL